MFEPGDTVALLAVSRWRSAAVVQEVQRVEDLARPESVGRLGAVNEAGYDGVALTTAAQRERTPGSTSSPPSTWRRPFPLNPRSPRRPPGAGILVSPASEP